MPSAQPRWVNARDGNIPNQAVPGGTDSDGETLYVGRAEINGNLIPGKIKPSHGVCYVAHEGREVANRSYQVLTSNGHEFEWVTYKPSVRYGFVPGGKTVDGSLLYIGRALHVGSKTIGKIFNNFIYIPYGGREVKTHLYEILCLKQNEL